jgi:hypothetical protein
MLLLVILIYVGIGVFCFETMRFGFQIMEQLNEPNVPKGKVLQTLFAAFFGIFWIFFALYWCMQEKEEER